MATPSSEELAWLSGLWDGEGSVGSHRASPTNVGPKLQMSMTCGKTIAKALDILNRLGASALGYSYQEKKSHHKNAHCIRVNRSVDILKVAEALKPYSVTKLEQWEAIIEQCEIKISRSRVMPDGCLARGGAPMRPITAREFELHEILAKLNHREKSDEA